MCTQFRNGRVPHRRFRCEYDETPSSDRPINGTLGIRRAEFDPGDVGRIGWSWRQAVIIHHGLKHRFTVKRTTAGDVYAQ